jgi:drug/metabolite transporter (DMT)-like permease
MGEILMAPTDSVPVQPTIAEGFSRSRWYGWGMALIATLAFSVATPIARGAILAGLPPATLLAVRFVVAWVLLVITLGISAPQQLRLDGRAVLVCFLGGTLNGIGMVCIFVALARLEASIASMIFSLNPLAVLALLSLRGEKFTQRHLLRLALGLGGVFLLINPSTAGRSIDWIGVGLVLVTVVNSAIFMSLLQWYLKDYDTRAVTLYIVTMMTAVSIVFWLIQGAHWQNPGWSGWLSILGLAVVSTYLARLTLFAAVRRLGSGQMSLLLPFEVLLTVAWSILFLGEWLTFWQWVGSMLVISSAVLAVDRLRLTGRRLRLRNWSRP